MPNNWQCWSQVCKSAHERIVVFSFSHPRLDQYFPYCYLTWNLISPSFAYHTEWSLRMRVVLLKDSWEITLIVPSTKKSSQAWGGGTQNTHKLDWGRHVNGHSCLKREYTSWIESQSAVVILRKCSFIWSRLIIHVLFYIESCEMYCDPRFVNFFSHIQSQNNRPDKSSTETKAHEPTCSA